MKKQTNKQTRKPQKTKNNLKKTIKRHTEPRHTPEILHICAYLYK